MSQDLIHDFIVILPPRPRYKRLFRRLWEIIEYHPIIVAFTANLVINPNWYSLGALAICLAFVPHSQRTFERWTYFLGQAEKGAAIQELKGELVDISGDLAVAESLRIAERDERFISMQIADEVWALRGSRLNNDGPTILVGVFDQSRFPSQVLARIPPLAQPRAFAHRLGSSFVLHRQYPHDDERAQVPWLFTLYHELSHVVSYLSFREIRYCRLFELVVCGAAILSTSLFSRWPNWTLGTIGIAFTLTSPLFILVWYYLKSDPIVEEINCDNSALSCLVKRRGLEDTCRQLKAIVGTLSRPRLDLVGYYRRANAEDCLRNFDALRTRDTTFASQFFSRRRVPIFAPHEAVDSAFQFPSRRALTGPLVFLIAVWIGGVAINWATLFTLSGMLFAIVIGAELQDYDLERSARQTEEEIARKLPPRVKRR